MTKKKKPMTMRQLQVSETIKRLIAGEVNEYINNNVEGDFITIMRAIISKDMRYCKIIYRCKIENRQIFQKLLDNISNHLSNYVYKQLMMRVRPEIHFIFDDTKKIIEEIERVVERNKESLD